MAYGLTIINDDLDLLIDSDYVNPTFVQKLEFNTTESAAPTYGDLYLHPGFIRRYYSTPTVSIGTGKYIVLWALPNQVGSNVWYMFPTSVAENNLQFDCSVFSNSNIVGSVSYSLPTAYVFTVDANGIGAMSSSGPALRMFNSANQKTFDSNFVQLAPYFVTNTFSVPYTTNGVTDSTVSVPTNPIFLLPKTALALATQRTASGVNYTDYQVFDVAFRRENNIIKTATTCTAFESELGSFAPGYVVFNAGTSTNLSIIVADANLYQASSAGTGGGTNPTYNLSRSVASVNEGGSFTITLTTTNVVNGTAVGYNVTGIQQADLSSGVTSGNFTVYNNTASLSFTVANDNLTDGSSPEVFRLEITTGTFPYIDVTINDTSLSPAGYSIAPQTGSVNEGSSITFTVTTTNVLNGTTLYWRYRGGSADPSADFIAYNGSFTVTNNSGTFSVTPSADALTEGSETFAIAIATTPTGLEVAYTGTITINDTSLTPAATYSITPAYSNVDEGGSLSFTVNGTNIANGTYYWSINHITTNAADFSATSGSFSISGNSGSFSVSAIADATTEGTQTFTVTVRSGSTSGTPLVTSSTINVSDTSLYPAYSTLLNAYCLSYGTSPYTYREVRADGNGGTYNVDTNNSPTCGYVAPVYNEFITIASDVGGDYIVELNGYFTLTIGGGAPNTVFQYAVLNNGDPQPSSYPASNTLDGSGYFVNYLTGSAASGSPADKRLWVYFNATGHVRSARVRVVADAGTLSGGQYCVGFTLTQNYNDGRGGTYSSTVQNNSPSCGYVQQYYPARSMSVYKYYNFDYQGDSWKLSGGRPYGPVTATITTGAYAGFALNGSFNGSGNYTQLIGDYGDLVTGNYTLAFTFPGDDAYYPVSYRTITATFQVVNASAGGGGIIP